MIIDTMLNFKVFLQYIRDQHVVIPIVEKLRETKQNGATNQNASERNKD